MGETRRRNWSGRPGGLFRSSVPFVVSWAITIVLYIGLHEDKQRHTPSRWRISNAGGASMYRQARTVDVTMADGIQKETNDGCDSTA